MTIRTTTPDDAPALRELRLLALRTAPEAFGTHHDEDAAQPPERWVSRCTPNENAALFVAAAGDGALMGMAGVVCDGRKKTGHAAFLWGVFVRPEARGSRLGTRLVETCLDWARARGLERARLSVVSSNGAAIRCYVRCGFSVYGVETDALRVDGVPYDELLMARALP